MDTKLKDMKMPKGKRGVTTMPAHAKQEYPWGLTLYLDSDSLKKLGIEDLPEVGTECMVHGVGKVTRVSESASEREDSRSVEIQITRLGIDHGEESFAKGFARGP